MYPPHHHGGYELVWQAAVEHMRAAGHDVRVLTTDYRADTNEPDPAHVFRELRWHLVDAEFQELRPWQVFAMARHNHRALDHHLRDLRPDVVAWWSMGGLTLALIESVRRRGLPAVAFVHDDWLDYGPVVDPWLKTFTGPRRGRGAPFAERVTGLPTRVDFGAAAEYVFVSDFTRRHALGLGRGLEPERTSVAHSGIHPAFLEAVSPPRDWRWRLLYVGRLDPRKGVDTAVAALPHLPAEATLTIVGGWDDREERRLTELATELGVDDRVVFAGERGRAELIQGYDATDVVVFPVRWNEPWGLVPLEAMARGRPVVATGRGGSGEYLRDGDNCLLSEADDAEALAAALRRLADDPALRARLRKHGEGTARQHTEPIFAAAVEQAVLRAAPEAADRAPAAVAG
jgi:glycogen(starch) synthase